MAAKIATPCQQRPKGGHGSREQGGLRKENHRRPNESQGGGADAAKHPLPMGVLLEGAEEERHQKPQDQGGGGDSQGGDQGSGKARLLLPDVGCRIQPHGPRRHLRQGHDVGELLRGHEAMAGDQLILEEGNHGVAAAEGEGANLHEEEIEGQEAHAFPSPWWRSQRCRSQPATPPARST